MIYPETMLRNGYLNLLDPSLIPSTRQSRVITQLNLANLVTSPAHTFCSAIIYDPFTSNFNLWECHFGTICLIFRQDVSGKSSQLADKIAKNLFLV